MSCFFLRIDARAKIFIEYGPAEVGWIPVYCQRILSGFSLLVMKIDPDAETPKFKESVISGECSDKKGIYHTRLLNVASIRKAYTIYST